MRNIGIINRIFDIRRQELVDKIELKAELEFVNKKLRHRIAENK